MKKRLSALLLLVPFSFPASGTDMLHVIRIPETDWTIRFRAGALRNSQTRTYEKTYQWSGQTQGGLYLHLTVQPDQGRSSHAGCLELARGGRKPFSKGPVEERVRETEKYAVMELVKTGNGSEEPLPGFRELAFHHSDRCVHVNTMPPRGIDDPSALQKAFASSLGYGRSDTGPLQTLHLSDAGLDIRFQAPTMWESEFEQRPGMAHFGGIAGSGLAIAIFVRPAGPEETHAACKARLLEEFEEYEGLSREGPRLEYRETAKGLETSRALGGKDYRGHDWIEHFFARHTYFDGSCIYARAQTAPFSPSQEAVIKDLAGFRASLSYASASHEPDENSKR